MSPRPTSYMPNAASALTEPLRVQVESIHTSAAEQPVEAPSAITPSATAVEPPRIVPSVEPTTLPVPEARDAQDAAVEKDVSGHVLRSSVMPEVDWDEKKVTSIRLRKGLKAQAETAVLLTGDFVGGYQSWVAIVEGALERELQRLADEFNDGVPFDPNTSTFRTGRVPKK